MNTTDKYGNKVGGISFFWSYSVEYYDEYDHKSDVAHGIVVANSFIEAVSRICEHYGEDNVCSILHLEGFDFGTGIFELDDLKEFIWSDDINIWKKS